MPSSSLDLETSDLRDLFDGISDLLQSVLPDGRIRFVNKPWLDRLGYTADEIEGRNIFDFLHPQARGHCMCSLQRLLAGEQVGVMETVFVTRSGEPVHLEGKVTVAYEQGVAVATRGVFREVPIERTDAASAIRLREQRRMFHSVLSMLRGNTNRNRGDFLSLVTHQVAQALRIARVSIWRLDPSKELLECESRFEEGKPHGDVVDRHRRADHPAYFAEIEAKLPIQAADAAKHPATQSFSKTADANRSFFDIPLRVGADVVGVLCCERQGDPRTWNAEEIEFGLTVAEILLNYMESERRIAAEKELQRLNAELERRVEQRSRQMAAAEQRLAYMLTSVSAVVFACEPGGAFGNTFVSANIESQLGYPAAEYLSHPHFWRDHLHPDDFPHAYDAMRKALAEGKALYEYRFRLPDGTYRWYRDEYTLLRDAAGQPLEIVGSCVDIHDRKTAEQSAQSAAADLRRLIETANAPIFGKDIHHRINEWNTCAERVSGYRRDEAIGRRLSDFAIPEKRQAVSEVLEDALHGRESSNFEFPMRTKEGRTVTMLLSASARRDATGKIVGVVGVGQDITEHREAERRNLRAQRLESIGTLAGGVAHDVNNSLAPILLATGLLRERHPESEDLLGIMESSARRGASMVQQLLTYAKGVDGKRVPVRPQILLAELDRIIKSTFPKNIHIAIACDPASPAVIGDSTQLHQVLLNLCVNARDAMPDGGKLSIEVARVDLTAADTAELGDGTPGAYLRIRILDSGCGIPVNLLDRIFEPFFSTKSPEQGTGLGLSTTLGIVRSHGGFMRVQSQLKMGSAFSVYLPMSVDDVSPVEIPSRANKPYRGRGQAVLVVDDEPTVRNVVKRLLTAMGFLAEAAADAETALSLLRKRDGAVSLIITDLHMPGMDGLSLTRAVRQEWPEVPVILASGFADKADPSELEELEFAAQLDKPFGMDTLTQALRSTLG